MRRWQAGHCPSTSCSNAELSLSLQALEDTQGAELGRAHVQVKRCSHCSATVGASRAEGTPPAESPGLCLQCSELRSELEALGEEYQWCLSRLRQCREELNRSHGSQAQVGACPDPSAAQAWEISPCSVGAQG